MPLQLRNSALTLAAVLCAACANDTPVVDMKGQCADANGGEVCTYARVQADHVMEAGAMVPLTAIENAKAGVESMDWPPKTVMTSVLPEVATKQSGLTELTMYWESTGHPPTPYMVPHFDFHFYIVPPADIAAIDCKDESKPTALPQGYSLPDQDLPPEMQKMMGVEKLVGICVPGMGMHSLPTTELQSTRPFNGTMVIGYYHAKPIFIEPMISKSMLLLKQSFTLPIPEIPGLTTVHPTAFHADFDAATQSYHFRFTDFKGA
jgi:hypothetical protein